MMLHQCRSTTPGPTTWLIQNEIICIPGSGNTGHLFNRPQPQPPHPHPHLPLPCSAVIPVVSPPCTHVLPPPPVCCTVTSAPVVLAHSEHRSLSSGYVAEYSDSHPPLTTGCYSNQTTCPPSNVAEYTPVSADLQYGHEPTVSVYTAAPTDVISEHFQRISSSSTPLAEYTHGSSEEYHVIHNNSVNTAAGCGTNYVTEHYQPTVTGGQQYVGEYGDYQSVATSVTPPVYTTSSEHYQPAATVDYGAEYLRPCAEEYQPLINSGYTPQLNASAPEFQQQISSIASATASVNTGTSEEYQSTVTSGCIPEYTQTSQCYPQTVMTSEYVLGPEEYQQEQATESNFIPQYATSPDLYQVLPQVMTSYNASDSVTNYATPPEQYQPQLNYAQEYIPPVDDYYQSPSVTSSYVTDYVTADSAQYQSAVTSNYESQYATQSEQYQSHVTSSYVVDPMVELHQPPGSTGHVADYNTGVEYGSVTSSYNSPDYVNYTTPPDQYQSELNYMQEYTPPPDDYHQSPSVTSSYVTDYVTPDSGQYQSAVTTSYAAQSENQYQCPVASSYADGSMTELPQPVYVTDHTTSSEQCPLASSYNASDCSATSAEQFQRTVYSTELTTTTTNTEPYQYHSTGYNASDDVTSAEQFQPTGTTSYLHEYTPTSEEYHQQYTPSSDPQYQLDCNVDFPSQSVNYQETNSFNPNTEFTPASEEYQCSQQLEYNAPTGPVEYVFQAADCQPATEYPEYPGDHCNSGVYHMSSYEDEYVTVGPDQSTDVNSQFSEYPGDYCAESQQNYQDSSGVGLQYPVVGESEEYPATGGYELHEYTSDPQTGYIDPYSDVTCPQTYQDETTSYAAQYTTSTSEEYQLAMTTDTADYYNDYSTPADGGYLYASAPEYLPDYVTEEYQPEMTSSAAYVPEDYKSQSHQMSGFAAEFVPASRPEEYQPQQTYRVARCPQTVQYSTEFNVTSTEQNQTDITTNYASERITYSEEYQPQYQPVYQSGYESQYIPVTANNCDQLSTYDVTSPQDAEEYQPTASINHGTAQHVINPLADEFRPKNLVVTDSSPSASNDEYQPTTAGETTRDCSEFSAPADYAASSDGFDPPSSSGYVSDNTPPYDDYLQSPASGYVVDYMAATELHHDQSQVVADAVEPDVIASQLADKLRLDDNNNKLLETTVATVSVTVNVSLKNSQIECSETCGHAGQLRYRSCDNPQPLNGGVECQGSSVESQQCQLQPCPVDGGWSEWSNWIVEGWSNWMVCSGAPGTGEPLCGVSGRSVQPAVEKDSKHDLAPATVQHPHTEVDHDTTEQLGPDGPDGDDKKVNRKTEVDPDTQVIVGVNVNLDTLKVSLELNVKQNMEVRTKGVKDNVSQVTKNYSPDVKVNSVTEFSPVKEVSSNTKVSLDTDNMEDSQCTEVDGRDEDEDMSTHTEVDRVKV